MSQEALQISGVGSELAVSFRSKCSGKRSFSRGFKVECECLSQWDCWEYVVLGHLGPALG